MNLREKNVWPLMSIRSYGINEGVPKQIHDWIRRVGVALL